MKAFRSMIKKEVPEGSITDMGFVVQFNPDGSQGLLAVITAADNKRSNIAILLGENWEATEGSMAVKIIVV